MSAFFDTKVFVAAVTIDTDCSENAIRALNEIEDGNTSILNVMELRSVLAKKKQYDRDRINAIEATIAPKTTVTFPDASDIVTANQRQSETLRYPMDALILAAAESSESPLVTFDSELLDHGAVTPVELL